jgi:hypothetical protein
VPGRELKLEAIAYASGLHAGQGLGVGQGAGALLFDDQPGLLAGEGQYPELRVLEDHLVIDLDLGAGGGLTEGLVDGFFPVGEGLEELLAVGAGEGVAMDPGALVGVKETCLQIPELVPGEVPGGRGMEVLECLGDPGGSGVGRGGGEGEGGEVVAVGEVAVPPGVGAEGLVEEVAMGAAGLVEGGEGDGAWSQGAIDASGVVAEGVKASSGAVVEGASELLEASDGMELGGEVLALGEALGGAAEQEILLVFGLGEGGLEGVVLRLAEGPEEAGGGGPGEPGVEVFAGELEEDFVEGRGGGEARCLYRNGAPQEPAGGPEEGAGQGGSLLGGWAPGEGRGGALELVEGRFEAPGGGPGGSGPGGKVIHFPPRSARAGSV